MLHLWFAFELRKHKVIGGCRKSCQQIEKVLNRGRLSFFP